MKSLNYFFVYFSVLVIASSCTSGKKAFESGNYDQSTIQAIERLRKNPTHKKSREVLSQSYPLAVRYHNERINNLRQSNEEFKNGLIIDEYERLNYLYEQIMRSPGALNVIPHPQKFYTEVQNLAQLAAEEQYSAGIKALGAGTRQQAKEAFYFFNKADEYQPGYKDARDKMDEARELATLKVLVDQIPVPTVNYKLSVEFFQDKVDEFLYHYTDNNFVRFFSTNDSQLKDPDQIMVLMFDEFTVGNVNNYQNSKEVTKDSVVVGKIKLASGREQNVIGTVKATYTEYRKEVSSKGLLSMKILDGRTNQIILHDKFPGEFVWVSRWANFNGDERALSEEQLSYTKHKPTDPPPPQDMFVEFTKPIYGQLTSNILNYYHNY